MKYWILLFGLLFIAEGLDAQKRKGVEYSTDVLMFAPPAAGFVKSLIQKDYTGMKQLMLGAATNLAACYILKYAVKKERPDHSDNHAFPSNHTSVAFQGAAFLQKRYGWKWGIPAYLLSAYVGWGRTYCKQHDWWDVLVGMVIGIGAAYIYPKSVIRISQCCMAMRNPLISPRWTGKTALFLKTLPDRGYACPLFCPNKPVLRLTRIG